MEQHALLPSIGNEVVVSLSPGLIKFPLFPMLCHKQGSAPLGCLKANIDHSALKSKHRLKDCVVSVPSQSNPRLSPLFRLQHAFTHLRPISRYTVLPPAYLYAFCAQNALRHAGLDIGGGLTGGNKFIPKELENSGFAVVAVNYRLLPKAHIRRLFGFTGNQ